MENSRFITVRRLVLRIIGIFLAGSLILELILGYYLKQEALTNLALEDARHTSELVFESLYTKMQEGWSKKDIEKILARLNTLREGMEIRLYRSPLVEKLYGAVPKDREAIRKDPLIAEAMGGREIIRLMDDRQARYLYPVKVRASCLSCHPNASVGDVNGVIDIVLPAQQIVVSLDRMIFYFIAALALFLLLFFLFFYWMFNKKLVRPMTELTRQIQSRSSRIDLEERIYVKSECRELKTLETVFNELMRRIRYYYDKLLQNISVDQLTGLYNINRLKKDLENVSSVSMALFNIDDFRELNDYYGFETGDSVLIEVSRHLLSLIGDDTRLYRIGGSEFVLLREEDFTEEEILSILSQLQRHLHHNPQLEDLRISLTAGVVRDQADRLIEKASIALSAAKRRNKPVEFYRNAKQIEADYKRHIRWMKEVDDAIDEDRILLYYQPIRAAVGTDTMPRYEALVRLVDRQGAIHSPGEFLDVVQHSRLYAKLTRTVLRKAFGTFRGSECAFSVNLGINDIKDPLCRNEVYEALRKFDDPSRVTIEILESEEVSDFDLVNDFIAHVRSIGGKVAIDDFGSGYSNFHYLIRMRVDYFKIDATLIRNIHTDDDSRMLVENIVQLARKLGVETVAEFVESEAIMQACIEMGIDWLQGYYIGKPQPHPEGCR